MAASVVDFIRFDSDEETSATEDVITEWNTEVQSSGDDGGHSRDVYYWMGKKYFMCVLAQHIASTTSMPTSIIDMDVRDTCTRRESCVEADVFQSTAQEAQRHYPFTEHFRLLQDHAGSSQSSGFHHTSSGDYEGLMACIGQNVLGGSRRSKKMMLQSLRKYCSEQISRHAWSADSTRRESFPVLRPVVSSSDLPSDGCAAPTLAQFAAALNERGIAVGTRPRFEVKPLRQNPPLFGATVSMHGRSFGGERFLEEAGQT